MTIEMDALKLQWQAANSATAERDDLMLQLDAAYRNKDDFKAMWEAANRDQPSMVKDIKYLSSIQGNACLTRLPF
jgi:hypothetical protein